MPETKLDVRTADGVADCYAFRPEGTGPWPAVLMLMDAYGIRPAMKQMAERLSADGYVVLLPNLFYRLGTYPPLDPVKVVNDPAERERMLGMARSLDSATFGRDLGPYLDALHQLPGVFGEKVGCVGYCFGGRLALEAAIQQPEQVAAAAVIHAGHLATPAPESPHRRVGSIRGRLYIGVADKDRGLTPEQQAELDQALRAAGVRFEMELYPGALHPFSFPDLPAYNAAAAEKQWERVLALFRETLARPARAG